VEEAEDVGANILAGITGGGKPYSYQEEAWREIASVLSEGRGAVFIRAPCGSGKTEAVIIPFMAQYATEKVFYPKMIYATPTQTLLYNMRDRIGRAISVLGEELKGVLAPEPEHGFHTNPTYLIPRVSITTYDVIAYAWVCRRTIPYRPFTTRGALLSSFIVFDEAHLLQDKHAYSQRIFPTLVASLVESGAPVAVISATLPTELIRKVREEIGDGRVREISFSEADRRRLRTGSLRVNRGFLSEPRVELERALGIIEERVSSALSEGKDVLIVVNSVKVAFLIYEDLARTFKGSLFEALSVKEAVGLVRKGNSIIMLLHGRLPIRIRKEREGVFERLKEYKRELARRGEPKTWSLIIVATQVAEVGVNYSFDVVITELAPPSALIQRFMRGGREEKQKSEAIVIPPIKLTTRGAIPTNLIYPASLLALSREWLEKTNIDKEYLLDVKRVTEIVDREYSIIEQEAGEEKWVENLVTLMQRISKTAQHISPLITRLQMKVLERYRLRLGEYLAISYLEDVDRIAGKKKTSDSVAEAFRNILREGGWLERVLNNSIRFSLRLTREKKKNMLTFRMPRDVIWYLENGYFLICLHGRNVTPISVFSDEEGNFIITERRDFANICGNVLLASSFRPHIMREGLVLDSSEMGVFYVRGS